MSEPELQDASAVAVDDRYPAGMVFEPEATEEEEEPLADGNIELGDGGIYIAWIDELLEETGGKGLMVREGMTFVLLTKPYRWVNIEKLEEDKAEQAKKAAAAKPKGGRGKVTPLRGPSDK